MEYVYTKKFKKADADIAAGVRYNYKNISGVTFGQKYSHYGAVYAQGEKRFDKRFTIKVGISLEYNKLDTVTLKNDLTFLNTLAVKDSAHKMSSIVKPVVNIGLNYQITEGTFLRGSFGQGYRFPDIAEEFVLTPRAGAVAIPNPNLKPESSWTAEIGIKQGMKFSRWVFYADVAAYISRYNNLIEFATAKNVPQYIKDKYGYQLFQQAQNTPHAQIWGIEASAIGTGAIFGVPLNFLLGYNYMDPKNLDYDPKNTSTHKYLYYRMRHSAKADIQTTYKGFIVGFTAVYIGRMLQLDQIASLSKIQSWTSSHSLKGDFVLDARVGYNWKDRFTATVIAKNMANREYTLRPGYVEAPANITLQVTYHWGKFIPNKKKES
jgi:iron complex outermembrane receptor protein